MTSIPDLLSIKSIESYEREYLNSIKIFLIYLIFFLALTVATYSASVLDSVTNSWHFDDYSTASLHTMVIYWSVKWPLSLQLPCDVLDPVDLEQLWIIAFFVYHFIIAGSFGNYNWTFQDRTQYKQYLVKLWLQDIVKTPQLTNKVLISFLDYLVFVGTKLDRSVPEGRGVLVGLQLSIPKHFRSSL